VTALTEIEGIGPAYREKLATAGINSVEALLEHGSTREGRQGLATSSGVSGDLLLEWVNHADLFRLRGVGSEFADLLEAAGVDSVPELAQRSAASLSARMAELNETRERVRQTPSEAQVETWIAEAKTLPRVVVH
jgi:predicted flap endonuclease-1-like 5' DNA nuclease